MIVYSDVHPSNSKKAKHAAAFLDGYNGVLIADAASNFVGAR